MTADLAHRYHRRTAHTPTSVTAGARRLDPSNRPAPFKEYRGVEARALPTDWAEPAVAARTVLSGGSGEQTDLHVEAAARLLFLAGGVTRRLRRGDRTVAFRAAPSAGALYPIELYLVCGELDGLPAGAHHYHPGEHALRCLRRSDVRAALARATAVDELARLPASIVLTGIPWRTTWKYGLRGWRHLFWDAGTITANLLTAAASAGLARRVLLGFCDREVDRLVGVGPGAAPYLERSLAVIGLGEPGRPAPEAEVGELDAEVEPLSRSERLPEGLVEVHAAGDLGVDEVARWRGHLQGEARETGPPPAPPAPAGTSRVDEVVLRRGSTRRFDPAAVAPRTALDWAVAVAGRSTPGDLAPAGRTLLRHAVAVHAVEGVPSGVHRWTDRGAVLVNEGEIRRETARACLGQPLGGSGALTAFHLADLDGVVGSAGVRGYRAAQFEAGVASGRLQLAAFALGLGGTGLTFFDDEVRSLVGADDWPMLVTAVGQPAYRARPGRRPAA